MRAPLSLKDLVGYRGRVFATFSDSIAYYDDEDLFIVTKNFGREGPVGVNIGSLPLSSFSETLQITENAVISGKTYILFNDCDFWDQNISDKLKYYDFDKLIRLENLVSDELKLKIGTDLFLKLEKIFYDKDFNKLAGLGPGLTPLGDDILSGMVLFDKSLTDIKIESVFSKHLFKHATKNEVPYPIMKFLETLNINFLKKMGSSSGLGYGLGIIKSIKSGGKNVKGNNQAECLL